MYIPAKTDEVGQITLASQTFSSENGAPVGRIADDVSNPEAENGSLSVAFNQELAEVEQLPGDINRVVRAAAQRSHSANEITAHTADSSELAVEVSGCMLEIMDAVSDLPEGCRESHRSSQQVHELAGNRSRLARQFFSRSELQVAVSGKTEHGAEDKAWLHSNFRPVKGLSSGYR